MKETRNGERGSRKEETGDRQSCVVSTVYSGLVLGTTGCIPNPKGWQLLAGG